MGRAGSSSGGFGGSRSSGGSGGARSGGGSRGGSSSYNSHGSSSNFEIGSSYDYCEYSDTLKVGADTAYVSFVFAIICALLIALGIYVDVPEMTATFVLFEIVFIISTVSNLLASKKSDTPRKRSNKPKYKKKSKRKK